MKKLLSAMVVLLSGLVSYGCEDYSGWGQLANPCESLKDLQAIADDPKACGVQAFFSISRLAVQIEDITEEKLKDITCGFFDIEALKIKGEGITANHVELLSQVFPKLEVLDLSRTYITKEGIEALAKENVFIALKELNLADNVDIKDKGIKALTKASFASQLESLNLRNTSITEVGVHALSQGLFKNLKTLNLAVNPDIKDAGIADLAEASFASQIESLDLYMARMTASGIAALYKFKALKKLNLGENNIRDAGMLALAKAPFAGQLESLDLENTRIGIAGIEALADSQAFKSLKALNLAKNPTTLKYPDKAIAILTTAPFAAALESLDLTDNNIEAVSIIENLIELQKFESLKVLKIAKNPIGDIGIYFLAQVPFVKQLESLDLSFTEIGSKELHTLLVKCKSLKTLNLSWNNGIDDEAMDVLMNAPFVGKLESLHLYHTGISETEIPWLLESVIAKKTILVNASYLLTAACCFF